MTVELSAARLDELCEFAPIDGTRAEIVYWFVRLVAWLRPRRGENEGTRPKFLALQLERKPAWKAPVSRTLARLVEESNLTEFFLSVGLSREFHFVGALRTWLTRRILPTPCDTTEVERLVTLAFQRTDLAWIRRSGVVALASSLLGDEARTLIASAMREAMLDLTHQLSAQAHVSAVRDLTPSERSPFRGLYDCVSEFASAPEESRALGAVHGRASQCAIEIAAMKTGLAERGADLDTTFLIMRMKLQLQRLVALADAVHGDSARVAPYFFVGLLRAGLRDNRALHLIDQSTSLIVQNVIDTSAEVGRAYLEPSHSSFAAAFRAGLGGGVIMAIATLIKFGLAALHLSVFWEGLVFSLNYAAAFAAAYLLHYTIATKLPAPMATAIARCLQSAKSHRERLGAFLAIWRDMVRLQIAGLVGNLVAVVPAAFAIDYAATRAFGHHIASEAKAHHVLDEQSLLGPSLVFAALTGFFLWFTSLIGASCDNWARVARVEASLATNVWTLRTIGLGRGAKWARAISARFGGLVGNVSLGFLLGGVPAAFAIVGIPIQIRHVTVSAGSVALAYASRTVAPSWSIIACVALIGVVNVVVSFALALWLALRPSGMTSAWPRALVRIGLKRWILLRT